MIPIQDLLHRIRWDPVFGQGRFEIAYVDHTAGHLVRVPFEAVRLDPAEPFGFEATGEDGEERFIPFHRVREVYRDGALIWQPNARDAAGNQLLMGYPIFWNQRNPALGTKGDVGLYDFSKYLIKDGSGPFVAASEHVKFLENKTVFKIFWNVDGQPWLTAPFTQEGGYQVSPFVVLDIPA